MFKKNAYIQFSVYIYNTGKTLFYREDINIKFCWHISDSTAKPALNDTTFKQMFILNSNVD